jgi:hypothetical protein
MKSQGLRELVSSIFHDETNKQSFISNPESFLSRYNLTTQEKQAVLATHTNFGLVASNSAQLEATLIERDVWF